MSGLEHYAFLRSIDDKWREHLMIMDELKEGIHLRAYGQKDPLLEYKGEALHAFQGLIQEIQKETVSVVFKYYPQVVPSNIPSRTDKNSHNPRESNLDHPSVTIGRSPSLGFLRVAEIIHPLLLALEQLSLILKTIKKDRNHNRVKINLHLA